MNKGFRPGGLPSHPASEAEVLIAFERAGVPYPSGTAQIDFWVLDVDGIVSVRGASQVDRRMAEEIPLQDSYWSDPWIWRAGDEVDERAWLDHGEVFMLNGEDLRVRVRGQL